MIIQTAPGGPVESFLAQINHTKVSGEVSSGGVVDIKNFNSDSSSSFKYQGFKYQGASGVDLEIISKIETGPNVFEDVSELNGLVIPSIYEKQNNNDNV